MEFILQKVYELINVAWSCSTADYLSAEHEKQQRRPLPVILALGEGFPVHYLSYCTSIHLFWLLPDILPLEWGLLFLHLSKPRKHVFCRQPIGFSCIVCSSNAGQYRFTKLNGVTGTVLAFWINNYFDTRHKGSPRESYGQAFR